MAHAISGRRFDHDFIQWFLPEYSRGRGRRNLALLVLASAEFLIDTFADVWAHQGQTGREDSKRKAEVPGIISEHIVLLNENMYNTLTDTF